MNEQQDTIITTPPVRSIALGSEALTVSAIRVGGGVLPWTHHDVTYPHGLNRNQFRVLCAIAREWSIDIVVEIDPSVEINGLRFKLQIWRIGPIGWRAITNIGVKSGEALRPLPQITGSTLLSPTKTACISEPLEAKLQLQYEDLGGSRRTIVSIASWTEVDHPVQVGKTKLGAKVEYDLFISYKAADQGTSAVDEIVAELRELGRQNVWFAPERLQGQPEFTRSILGAIQASRAHLIIWSDHSDDKGGTNNAEEGQSREDGSRTDGGIVKMNQYWEVGEIASSAGGYDKKVWIYDVRTDPQTDCAAELKAKYADYDESVDVADFLATRNISTRRALAPVSFAQRIDEQLGSVVGFRSHSSGSTWGDAAGA